MSQNPSVGFGRLPSTTPWLLNMRGVLSRLSQTTVFPERARCHIKKYMKRLLPIPACASQPFYPIRDHTILEFMSIRPRNHVFTWIPCDNEGVPRA